MADRSGIAGEWLAAFSAEEEGVPALVRLAKALFRIARAGDEAPYAVACDLGCLVARVVKLDTPRRLDENAPDPLARQWRWAQPGEPSTKAIVLPVASDPLTPGYAPGVVPLSLAALGGDLFLDSICDLVALPFDGGAPLSMTGHSLAIGRFAVRERGEVEIFAGGISWLNTHLARARELRSEMGEDTPPNVVVRAIEGPEHFSTLVIAPEPIEWRPSRTACALPATTKSLIIRDSMGLANLIDALVKRKDKVPPPPKVFGPKAASA